MDDVAAREVPVYFEVEEEIISAPSKVMHRSANAVPLGGRVIISASVCWSSRCCSVSKAVSVGPV